MPPDYLIKHLENLINKEITHIAPMGGGDSHASARLMTSDGKTLFLKYNSSKRSVEMFRTEAMGLALIGASGVIAIPKIYAHGSVGHYAFLLLDYIPPGSKTRMFWEKFGAALATLHGTTAPQYGFAHDNFIGNLPQSNTRHDTWQEFYTEERLLPQLRLAIDTQLLDMADGGIIERICTKLENICPPEQPALIHGDLWSGNFLCNTEGNPVLIDPAACYAHREMDLAMSRLFEGFDPVFYQSYEAAWPLAPGFEQRLGVYQLYYLLVHVNMFGGNYVDRTRAILKKWS